MQQTAGAAEPIGLAIERLIDAPVALVFKLWTAPEHLARWLGPKDFTAHAVRYLCACKKDRSSDEMLNWVKGGMAAGELLPQIPDYAADMHTRRGQEMGRGFEPFLTEASRVQPELETRDRTYYERLLAAYHKGK